MTARPDGVIDYGTAPKGGWARTVCELLVTDLAVSRAFWEGVLGFTMAYQRPEQAFVYLERPEVAQIMLCQRSGNWETGALEPPFGRGVMIQVFVDDLAPVQAAIAEANWPIHTGPREVWRRYGDREGGKREIVVQDPDGYLVMIAQDIGERPLSA